MPDTEEISLYETLSDSPLGNRSAKVVPLFSPSGGAWTEECLNFAHVMRSLDAEVALLTKDVPHRPFQKTKRAINPVALELLRQSKHNSSSTFLYEEPKPLAQTLHVAGMLL